MILIWWVRNSWLFVWLMPLHQYVCKYHCVSTHWWLFMLCIRRQQPQHFDLTNEDKTQAGWTRDHHRCIWILGNPTQYVWTNHWNTPIRTHQKILKIVGMESCIPNTMPAKEQPLHHDSEGEPFDEIWDYASVIGMLMYLINTCPNIRFAVHQCAKYAHFLMKSHGNAIKKICWYLQGMKHKGLHFSTKPIPGPEICINCYVDASFATLWDIEDAQSFEGVKSRTRCIIHLNDCPVTWSSKQQGCHQSNIFQCAQQDRSAPNFDEQVHFHDIQPTS